MATTPTEGQNFKMARAYINGCIARKEVIPGSCDTILEKVALGDPSAEKVLVRAHSYVFGGRNPRTGAHEDGPGRGFLDVEHRRDPENSGSAAARRLVAGKFLTEAAGERIGREWDAGVAEFGFGIEPILERGARRFESRESRDDLTNPGPLPREEVAALEGLEPYRHDLAPGFSPESLAEGFADLHRSYGHNPATFRNAVAARLAGRPELLRDAASFRPVSDADAQRDPRHAPPDGPAAGARDERADLRASLLGTGRYAV